jgi:3-oxoacyl-[acyl-carrier protein] reductase
MEQAALLMMQQVLAAELSGEKRVFALQLGPVRTRFTEASGTGDPDWVSAGQIGAVAVAASAATSIAGQRIRLLTRAEADEALTFFGAA